MAPISRNNTLRVVLLVLASVLSTNAAILRCSEAKRCGLFSVTMHKMIAATNACQETCVMFPILKSNVKCGACPTNSTSAPAIPVKITKAPVQAPKAVPTKAPVKSDPVPCPIKAPTKSPVIAAPAPTKATSAPIPALKKPTVAPVKAPTPAVAAPSGPAGEYSIQLQLVGIPTADQALFSNAKARWERVISGDLADAPSTGLQSVGGGCEYPAKIDDLYICASYRPIDSSMGVVGLAGPHYNRLSDTTPFVGSMEFDTADLDFLKSAGSFVDTVLHEMGHVLGVGTNWNDKGLVNNAATGCPYSGVHANREHEAVSGCTTTVAMEQEAGLGACSHWSEECLVDELMTGLLMAGTPALLSRITVGSLADLGYTVDYSKADVYTSANLGAGCTCARTGASASKVRGSKKDRFLAAIQHGETIQLRGNKTQKRRLSAKAHQAAVSYGRSVLAERSLSKPARTLLSNDNAVYIGDQVISVLMREGDDIYGVVVKTDAI